MQYNGDDDDDDDLFASLGGSLMKDLLADLNAEEEEDGDGTTSGFLTLDQLERELAHLDGNISGSGVGGGGGGGIAMMLPPLPEMPSTAASLVVAAQQRAQHYHPSSSAGFSTAAVVSPSDAWTASLEKFTAASLQARDFLQADSARKQQTQQTTTTTTTRGPPGLDFSRAEVYDVTEPQVAAFTGGVGGGIGGPPPGIGSLAARVVAAAPPQQQPHQLAGNLVMEQAAQRLAQESKEGPLLVEQAAQKLIEEAAVAATTLQQQPGGQDQGQALLASLQQSAAAAAVPPVPQPPGALTPHNSVALGSSPPPLGNIPKPFPPTPQNSIGTLDFPASSPPSRKPLPPTPQNSMGVLPEHTEAAAAAVVAGAATPPSKHPQNMTAPTPPNSEHQSSFASTPPQQQQPAAAWQQGRPGGALAVAAATAQTVVGSPMMGGPPVVAGMPWQGRPPYPGMPMPHHHHHPGMGPPPPPHHHPGMGPPHHPGMGPSHHPGMIPGSPHHPPPGGPTGGPPVHMHQHASPPPYPSHPAMMSPPPPPPTSTGRPVYANPHPRAPPVPASVLASQYMSARDISYVVHAILKPLLLAPPNAQAYDAVYWQRQGMAAADANKKKTTPDSKNKRHQPKDPMSKEMTSRAVKAKEWSTEHATLGHTAKTHVSRPRALIAQPLRGEEADENQDPAEQRARKVLWKARIYVDQAYQAYLGVVDAWRDQQQQGPQAAAAGRNPNASRARVQAHLHKLLKCLGLTVAKTQATANDDNNAPPASITYEYAGGAAGNSGLALLLKLPKGRVLLARVLEQALLPPPAVQVLLPAALQVLYEMPSPVAAPSNADEARAQDLDRRLFGAWTRVVQSLPAMSPTCLRDAMQCVLQTPDRALGAPWRMPVVHALLHRGGSLAHALQQIAPSTDAPPDRLEEAKAFCQAWEQMEADFVKVLAAMPVPAKA